MITLTLFSLIIIFINENKFSLKNLIKFILFNFLIISIFLILTDMSEKKEAL